MKIFVYQQKLNRPYYTGDQTRGFYGAFLS